MDKPLPDAWDATTDSGRWIYEKKIGEGGFGHVWRSRDVHTNDVVAIKVLKTRKWRDSALASREVRYTRRFETLKYSPTGHTLFSTYIEDHTGLDCIQEEAFASWAVGRQWKGTDAGSVVFNSDPYIVLELIPGTTVNNLISGNRLSQRERIEILHQSASALQHLWQHRCIHRDFRVHNLMWHNHRLKVIDFGLCLHTADPAYAASTNPLYCTYWREDCYWIPPEVKQPNSETKNLVRCNFYREAPASFDIYGLGVVALELMLDPKFSTLLRKSKHIGSRRVEPHKAMKHGYLTKQQISAIGLDPMTFCRSVSQNPKDRPTAMCIISCMEKLVPSLNSPDTPDVLARAMDWPQHLACTNETQIRALPLEVAYTDRGRSVNDGTESALAPVSHGDTVCPSSPKWLPLPDTHLPLATTQTHACPQSERPDDGSLRASAQQAPPNDEAVKISPDANVCCPQPATCALSPEAPADVQLEETKERNADASPETKETTHSPTRNSIPECSAAANFTLRNGGVGPDCPREISEVSPSLADCALPRTAADCALTRRAAEEGDDILCGLEPANCKDSGSGAVGEISAITPVARVGCELLNDVGMDISATSHEHAVSQNVAKDGEDGEVPATAVIRVDCERINRGANILASSDKISQKLDCDEIGKISAPTGKILPRIGNSGEISVNAEVGLFTPKMVSGDDTPKTIHCAQADEGHQQSDCVNDVCPEVHTSMKRQYDAVESGAHSAKAEIDKMDAKRKCTRSLSAGPIHCNAPTTDSRSESTKARSERVVAVFDQQLHSTLDSMLSIKTITKLFLDHPKHSELFVARMMNLGNEAAGPTVFRLLCIIDCTMIQCQKRDFDEKIARRDHVRRARSAFAPVLCSLLQCAKKSFDNSPSSQKIRTRIDAFVDSWIEKKFFAPQHVASYKSILSDGKHGTNSDTDKNSVERGNQAIVPVQAKAALTATVQDAMKPKVTQEPFPTITPPKFKKQNNIAQVASRVSLIQTKEETRHASAICKSSFTHQVGSRVSPIQTKLETKHASANCKSSFTHQVGSRISPTRPVSSQHAPCKATNPDGAGDVRLKEEHSPSRRVPTAPSSPPRHPTCASSKQHPVSSTTKSLKNRSASSSSFSASYCSCSSCYPQRRRLSWARHSRRRRSRAFPSRNRWRKTQIRLSTGKHSPYQRRAWGGRMESRYRNFRVLSHQDPSFQSAIAPGGRIPKTAGLTAKQTVGNLTLASHEHCKTAIKREISQAKSGSSTRCPQSVVSPTSVSASMANLGGAYAPPAASWTSCNDMHTAVGSKRRPGEPVRGGNNFKIEHRTHQNFTAEERWPNRRRAVQSPSGPVAEERWSGRCYRARCECHMCRRYAREIYQRLEYRGRHD